VLRGKLFASGLGIPKWPHRFWWMFVALGIVASIFGMVPMDGFVETLRLILLTGVGYGFCWALTKLERPAQWIGTICSIALVLLSAVAFGQHFKLAAWLPEFGVYPNGTMGNANFMGSALMLLIPGAILGLRENAGRIIFAVVVVGMGLCAMYWAHSAGAWIGLMAGLAVAGLYIVPLRAGQPGQLRIKTGLLALTIVVGAAGLAYFGQNTLFGGQHDKINLTQDSGVERVLMWERSLDISYDHPLLGCGPDNWNYAVLKRGFVGQYQGFATRYYMQGHNDYLQALAEYGIPGGACLILFFFGIAWIGWRRQRTETDRNEVWLTGLAFGGWIAWMVNALLSFPFHQPYHMLLLMLWMAVLGRKPLEQTVLKTNPTRLILTVLILSSILGIGWYSLKIKANARNFEVIAAKEAQDWPMVLRKAEAAEAWYNPDEGITKTPITWYKGIAALTLNRPIEALQYLEAATTQNPWHPMVASNYAVALVYTGDLPKATRTLSNLLSTFPAYDDARINLVSVYIALKDWDQADLTLHHWHRLETNTTINQLRKEVEAGRKNENNPTQ
jgi:O-antigen ligase